MKLDTAILAAVNTEPAAFRRLCVETAKRRAANSKHGPAAFRRLCVETSWVVREMIVKFQPPSGGCVLKRLRAVYCFVRLPQPPSGGCVLKPTGGRDEGRRRPSRLQAAVC